ncbi:MAG: pyruvate dehydrogenase (acetyl-transferring) E1 component subunit alpha [Acidimicrobiia bacterium]|nr:pyruvate dehydrogenase (acetyl-transferring) E1 component subunit alpha [Acidimicrobiia bacterium]
MTSPSNAQLREILVDMVMARTQSGRLWNLQRQGQVGTVAPIDGHEATIVAAVHALDTEHDWVAPQYREPLALRRYGPEILERFMLYSLGHPAGGHIPEPIRVLPNQISLGTQIPHAVGIAWGMTLRSEPGVALVFFGDGSSSEGDFYEAGNLAGVLNAPVVMLCVNNQWAISTPVHQQTAAESFAAKAAGFGIPGIKVDGNDAAAVYDAVDEARSRALAGKGPTLVEAVIYRLGAHTTADDPTRYVPPEDLEAARRNDPILRLRSQLEELGLWDDDAQAATEAEAMDLLDNALDAAKAMPLSPDAVLDHCFSADTQRLERQRADLLEAGQREDR